MKIRFGRCAFATSALLIIFLLSATPSFADGVLYSNGGVDDSDLYAWPINQGIVVANSFTLNSASTVNSIILGLWVNPGDSPTGTSWAIVSGTPNFVSDNVVATGTGAFSTNNFEFTNPNSDGFLFLSGHSAFTSTLTGLGVSLGKGTYYLELFGATSGAGSLVGWEITNEDSIAYVNVLGNVNNALLDGTNSNAFTIYGSPTVTPEPGTMLMFGTGALGLLGAVRRRFSL